MKFWQIIGIIGMHKIVDALMRKAEWIGTYQPDDVLLAGIIMVAFSMVIWSTIERSE